MSVNGISSSLQYQSPLIQPSRRQSEDQIGRELEQALQNGDLSGAEQAYTQLAAFGANNSGPFADPTLKADFQALGQDLASGNLAQAQSDNTAMTTGLLKKDAQAVIQASKGNGSPTGGSLQAALNNLKGDYWAVYGQAPTESQLQSFLNAGSSQINLQA